MRSPGLLVKMVVGVISFLLLKVTAGAAAFPDRPIQALVGWPVGSLQDTVDRAIAKPLSVILGQPVIVQNMPGGGGALVLGRIKLEKPDGYTLFATGLPPYSQIPWTRPVPYDSVKDFAYLAMTAASEHYLLCRSDSYKTYEELIQYAKNNPKKVKYGTTGVGGPMHILMEYLAAKEKLQWVHVPFNSGPEVTTALLGGHIDLEVMTCGPELEYVKTGRFHPLLCLNDKRMEALPNLSTIAEKGYDYAISVGGAPWTVPVATPKDIQKILEKALLQSIANPEVKNVVQRLNKIHVIYNSEETTKIMIKEYEKMGELMKEFGLGIFKK
jgi:tripartite-type tricarboxylate transporter receptor subunit TctC